MDIEQVKIWWGRLAGWRHNSSCTSSPETVCRWTRGQCCWWRPKAVRWENSLLLRETGLFLLPRPSVDRMRPTRRYGGRSAVLKVHWFQCKSHPKTPSEEYPEWCSTKYLSAVAKLIHEVTVIGNRPISPCLSPLICERERIKDPIQSGECKDWMNPCMWLEQCQYMALRSVCSWLLLMMMMMMMIDYYCYWLWLYASLWQEC